MEEKKSKKWYDSGGLEIILVIIIVAVIYCAKIGMLNLPAVFSDFIGVDPKFRLVGHWVLVAGNDVEYCFYGNDKIFDCETFASIELGKNGTGTFNGIAFSWDVFDKYLTIENGGEKFGDYEYEISGSELVITHESDDVTKKVRSHRSTFVKEKKVEAWKAKRKKKNDNIKNDHIQPIDSIPASVSMVSGAKNITAVIRHNK